MLFGVKNSGEWKNIRMNLSWFFWYQFWFHKVLIFLEDFKQEKCSLGAKNSDLLWNLWFHKVLIFLEDFRQEKCSFGSRTVVSGKHQNWPFLIFLISVWCNLNIRMMIYWCFSDISLRQSEHQNDLFYISFDAIWTRCSI